MRQSLERRDRRENDRTTREPCAIVWCRAPVCWPHSAIATDHYPTLVLRREPSELNGKERKHSLLRSKDQNSEPSRKFSWWPALAENRNTQQDNQAHIAKALWQKDCAAPACCRNQQHE